ncbi:SusC/RagA family TonB-linked outer membrane protein [Robertkochia sediminum]|uniref:SusC/RagA family TonB-linked outer membrane protein n=1 Tax=Robertkochia sediminum TaxID=2785326 RepID=UPI001931A042|nr:SusC/RagA family TonB-linked outer membrane protein [Robertkochia sediminum]MBL7474016.1 SusC/RagA family TonB-linked outer membrane protein [Robertkochia sediminum]
MKSNLLKSLMLLGAFMCFAFTQAQTVSGTVSDASGPLPGANVLVKGTTIGTQTDFDGNYTLENVPSDGVLVFSYVGFVTQEVPVNGRSNISVTLEENAQALGEVVVIGYGTQAVQDATGAVDVVSSDDFQKGVISSPEQLIQGKTAGVQITQTSGEPGAGVNIRIRGTASVRSNNNPLFVVDGVPLAADDSQSGGTDVGVGATSARNPLNFLNPNDIESISILKDASATAIYGSRGANGVVLITTKGGKAGAGGRWEVNANVAHATPANDFDLLDRDGYLAGIAQYGNDPSGLDFGSNTDWQQVVTRNAMSPIADIAYSNNWGSGNVRTSFGYQKQFGVIENSSQERITGRLNLSQRFMDDKLKIDFNGTLSRVNDESPLVTRNAGSQGDILGAAYFANPTYPNDPTFDPGGAELNPANLLTEYQDLANTNRVLLNASAEYEIVENLKAKVIFGYDFSKSDRNQTLTKDVVGFNNGTIGNGRGALNEVNQKNNLLDATLSYNKEFDNSALEALVGYSYQSFQRYGATTLGFGYGSADHGDMRDALYETRDLMLGAVDGDFQQIINSPDLDQLAVNRLFSDTDPTVSRPGGIPIVSSAYDRFDFTDELQSFFGRVNYTIADKYIVTATLRADGSTRFGPNNKYGYFPSAAVAWKIHEEDFMGDAFSNLKLRLGWGRTGNQDGLGYGNYLFRERFGGVGIQNNGNIVVPGLALQSLPEDDLKWETTTQYNIGLDFGLGLNRLNGSVDLYYKNTTDLLLRTETAAPSPQDFNFSNLDANVINKGIEFAINYDVISTENTFWTAGFNIAYNENMVEDLGGIAINTGEVNGNGLTGAFAQILTNNAPLFSYYLREFGGFDENGISIYPDGDVQQLVGKSALPDITMGFNTSFSYKRWSLDAFITGQYGQYIYNNTANAFFTAGIINGGKNVTSDVLTNGESPANAPDVSTRFLESGDFTRLQTLSLAYDVPLSGEGSFDSMRLSVTGQNLFVITPYSGLDPEVNVDKSLNNVPSLGIDYSSFPRPRTITVGLSATF